jgi:hypothetical protein
MNRRLYVSPKLPTNVTPFTSFRASSEHIRFTQCKLRDGLSGSPVVMLSAFAPLSVNSAKVWLEGPRCFAALSMTVPYLTTALRRERPPRLSGISLTTLFSFSKFPANLSDNTSSGCTWF